MTSLSECLTAVAHQAHEIDERRFQAAYQTILITPRICQAGVTAYKLDKEKSLIFGRYWSEITRSFFDSFLLGVNGYYMSAVVANRISLETAVNMILDLLGITRIAYYMDTGEKCEKHFSGPNSKLQSLVKRRILDDTQAGYLAEWYSMLSEPIHGGDMDFDQSLLHIASRTEAEPNGHTSADFISQSVSDDSAGEEPSDYSEFQFLIPHFEHDKFIKWFDVFWINYKAIVALVSKIFMQYWITDPSLIPNRLVKERIEEFKSRQTKPSEKEKDREVFLDFIFKKCHVLDAEDFISAPHGRLRTKEIFLGGSASEDERDVGYPKVRKTGNNHVVKVRPEPPSFDERTGIHKLLDFPLPPSIDGVDGRWGFLRLQIGEDEWGIE